MHDGCVLVSPQFLVATCTKLAGWYYTTLFQPRVLQSSLIFQFLQLTLILLEGDTGMEDLSIPQKLLSLWNAFGIYISIFMWGPEFVSWAHLHHPIPSSHAWGDLIHPLVPSSSIALTEAGSPFWEPSPLPCPRGGGRHWAKSLWRGLEVIKWSIG